MSAIIDYAACDTCGRSGLRVKANGRDLHQHGPRSAPCTGRPVLPPVTPEPVPVPTCDHRAGNPGCELDTCKGVPTPAAINAATVDLFTPGADPVPGEFGVAISVRELRAQVARAVPGAEVTMPSWATTRAAGYGMPGRSFAVYRMQVAGRAVAVVEYAEDHYAVTVDGTTVDPDVRYQRHDWAWRAWAVARVIADHIEATATDADRARAERELNGSHAYTWAYSRWGSYAVAEAYRAWFLAHGDPDADHSAQVAAFAVARADLVGQDGRTVDATDAEPVAPVAPDAGPQDAIGNAIWDAYVVARGEQRAADGPAPTRTDLRARVETFRGRKLRTAAGPEWGTVHQFVNGQFAGSATGAGPEALDRAAAQLRRDVIAADEIRITNPDAFPAFWYEGAPEPHPAVVAYVRQREAIERADRETLRADPAPVVTPPDAEPVPLPAFTVPTADLAAALAYLAKGTPSRTPIPILSGVQLTACADTGTVRLDTFDYEQHRAYTFPAGTANGVESGRTVVSCRRLTDMVKACPKGADLVTVGGDGSRVTLAAGTRRYTLPTMPAEDYPALPDAAPTVGTVSLAAFADTVRRVALACGRDDALPMLTGVQCTLAGAGVSLAATDRFRLTVADVPWSPVDPDATATVTAPRVVADVLTAYAKVAGKAGGTVTVGATGYAESVGGGAITMAWGRYLFTAACLDGQFPKVNALLSDGWGARAEIGAPELTDTVKGVAVACDRATPVRLTVDPDRVTLAAGSIDGDRAEDTLPCTVETGTFLAGKERMTLPAGFTVAFNHQYLLEALSAVAAPRVTLSVTTPKHPVIIDAVAPTGTPVRYLIMPVRIGDGDGGDPVPVAPDAGNTDATPDADPAPDTTTADPAPVAGPAETETTMPTTTATDADPAPVATPDAAPAEPVTPVTDPEHEETTRRARVEFDAGRYAEALALLDTIPAGYMVAGRRPVEKVRAYIEARMPAPAPVVDPEPEPVAVAPVTPEPVVVAPTVPAAPEPVAPVVVAPAAAAPVAVAPIMPPALVVADPVDAGAVAAAESAAVATLETAPAPAPAVATDGSLVLTYTLPSYALLAAGGSSYKQEKKRVRVALNAARRAPSDAPDTVRDRAVILREVVCHVESVDGNRAAFTVTATVPPGVDPGAVRVAVENVVTETVVTVVPTLPAIL